MFAVPSRPGLRAATSIPYLRAMTEIPTPEPEDATSPANCPECGAAGSLVELFCEVCYAEFDEASA
jgi:hypothetical protein